MNYILFAYTVKVDAALKLLVVSLFDILQNPKQQIGTGTCCDSLEN